MLCIGFVKQFPWSLAKLIIFLHRHSGKVALKCIAVKLVMRTYTSFLKLRLGFKILSIIVLHTRLHPCLTTIVLDTYIPSHHDLTLFLYSFVLFHCCFPFPVIHNECHILCNRHFHLYVRSRLFIWFYEQCNFMYEGQRTNKSRDSSQ